MRLFLLQARLALVPELGRDVHELFESSRPSWEGAGLRLVIGDAQLIEATRQYPVQLTPEPKVDVRGRTY